MHRESYIQSCWQLFGDGGATPRPCTPEFSETDAIEELSCAALMIGSTCGISRGRWPGSGLRISVSPLMMRAASAASPHPVVQRGALLERSQAGGQSLLEVLALSDAGCRIVCKRVRAEPRLLPGMLAALGARLHRNLDLGEMQRVAKLLLGLLQELSHEEHLESAVLALAEKFVDLWVVLGREAASFVSAPWARCFLLKSLSAQCRHQSFSATYSGLELQQHAAQLLMGVLCYPDDRGEDARHPSPSEQPDKWQVLEDFIRYQSVTAATVQQCITVTCTLLGGLKCLLRQRPRPGLGLAVLELIWKCKRAEPSTDTCPLIRGLADLGQMHPASFLICSHPVFSESEMLELFTAASSADAGSNSSYARCAALLLLADYPHLSEGEARLLEEQIVESEGLSAAASECVPASVQDAYVLLACGLVHAEASACVSAPFTDANLAHLEYFVAARRLLLALSRGGSERVLSELNSLVEITKNYPRLAQRTLLLAMHVLRAGPGRAVVVGLVKALLEMAPLDEFCSTRVTELMRCLVPGSPQLRRLLLPLLARALAPLPSLFAVISENLSPLLFGGDGGQEGALAYAICLHRMAKVSNRQSFLKFVFASVAAGLQHGSRSDTRLDGTTMALLLLTLKQLIELRFVSPAIVWGEFVKDRLDLYPGDQVFAGICCQIGATLCEYVPEHEEDYPAANPVCAEACRILVERLYPKHPAAALYSLAHYPEAFLRSCGVDVGALFRDMCSRRPMTPSNMVAEHQECYVSMFVTKWVDFEVAHMSRSLFLGTATSAASGGARPTGVPPSEAQGEGAKIWNVAEGALRERASLGWKMNPLLAAIDLERQAGDAAKFCDTFMQVCTVPPLALQHWLLRLEFVEIALAGLDRLFFHLQDEGTEGLGPFLASCSASLEGLTHNGQAVAVVSMAVLLWGLLYSAAARHDLNQQRTLQQLERLLGGSLINVRFATNEDVQSAILLTARELWCAAVECNESSTAVASEGPLGIRIEALLGEYLGKECKVKPHSWLQFVRDAVLQSSWPALMLRSPGGKTESFSSPRGEDHKEASYEVLMRQLLSTQGLKDMSEAREKTAQLTSSEPSAFSGMLQYGLGVFTAKGVVTALEREQAWQELLEALKSPGPAIKKISTCCKALGWLQNAARSTITRSELAKLAETLCEALERCTDQRLTTWLAVLLDRTVKLGRTEGAPDGDGQRAAAGSGPTHRFGLESVFGACLELLTAAQPGSYASRIVDGLARTRALPRLDWSSILSATDGQDFEHPRAQLSSSLSLAWNHYHSQTADGSQYVNASLLKLLVSGIIEEPACIHSQLDRLPQLLSCLAVDDREAELERLLTACAGEQAGISRAALTKAVFEAERRAGGFKSARQRLFLVKLLYPYSHSTAELLEAWGKVDWPELPRDTDALLKFGRTKALEDGIAAYRVDPNSLAVVAAGLASQKMVLSGLGLRIMFCIDDAPTECPILFSLLKAIVRCQVHPFVSSLSWIHADRLAWRYRLCCTPGAEDDAASLQGRLRRVEALLPSCGLGEEEAYWTAC